MAKIAVLDMAGKQVSERELSDAVFAVTPNEAVETEGYRSRKTGFHPCSAVDTRRRCTGPEAP